MVDAQTAAYIASLPEVETSRLPEGTLFLAQGQIYQVIETGAGGFHKARAWRQSQDTEVALIAGSFPAKHLPLVRRGKLLPVYRSRLELTQDGQATCFVFPTETLARDAAYLDVTLVQSSGAFVRHREQEPAYAVTDGVHVFRHYYYRQSAHGRRTDLSSLRVYLADSRPRPHTEGPLYWRLLPGWTGITGSLDTTQAGIPVVKITPGADETVPNISINPPEE